MPIFKAPNNDTFRANSAAGLPDGCVEITEEELALLLEQRKLPIAPPSKEQRRRQILDLIGCFNLIHLEKDWALLESERQRLGITVGQAYIDNVTYRALSDARTALAAIDAE